MTDSTSTTVWTTETMTGFAGVMFRIGWDGLEVAAMPGWEQESIIVQNHIVGSNITETDLLGLGPYVRSFTIQVEDDVTFHALRLLQQTEGTLRVPARMNDVVDLDWSEETTDGDVYALLENVLLVSLTQIQNWTDGVKTAVATFHKEPNDG